MALISMSKIHGGSTSLYVGLASTNVVDRLHRLQEGLGRIQALGQPQATGRMVRRASLLSTTLRFTQVVLT